MSAEVSELGGGVPLSRRPQPSSSRLLDEARRAVPQFGTWRALGLADQPTWCVTAWALLAVLLAWNYGANNVALPGIPVPVADLLFGVLLVVSRRWWLPYARREGAVFSALLGVLAVVVVVRLAVDVRAYGLEAVRGALFAYEAWAVMLGVAMARRLGRPTVVRTLSAVLAIAVAWFVLYPWREQVAEFGPQVGIRRPVALFNFARAGLLAAWVVFWFALRRGSRAWLGVALGLGVLVLAQSRGTFIGFAGGVVAIVAAGVAGRRSVSADSHRLMRRLAGAMVAVVAVLALLPPLPGRLGRVSIDTYLQVAQSTVGADVEIGSSFNDRLDWYDTTFEVMRAERLSWMTGVGFGVDLTGEFSAGTSEVVNPHNDYLEYFARLGLFSLPWFGLWVVAWRRSWAAAVRADRLALWLVGSFVVTVAVSLTQPVSAFAYGGMVWWMMAGLVLGCIDQPGPPVRQPTARGVAATRS